MRKADEIMFFKAIQEANTNDPVKNVKIRDVVERMNVEHGMSYNRCIYLLEKWARQGLYEYGVSVLSWWLIGEGVNERNAGGE